jgi:hypothetical protein
LEDQQDRSSRIDDVEQPACANNHLGEGTKLGTTEEWESGKRYVTFLNGPPEHQLSNQLLQQT